MAKSHTAAVSAKEAQGENLQDTSARPSLPVSTSGDLQNTARGEAVIMAVVEELRLKGFPILAINAPRKSGKPMAILAMPGYVWADGKLVRDE